MTTLDQFKAHPQPLQRLQALSATQHKGKAYFTMQAEVSCDPECGPPLRASQVNKAELAAGDVLGLQVGGLNYDGHDEVGAGGLPVHLRAGRMPPQLALLECRDDLPCGGDLHNSGLGDCNRPLAVLLDLQPLLPGLQHSVLQSI